MSSLPATDVPGACLCKKEYDYQFEKCDPVIWKGFIRDNICHDKTNTKECNFDGGDCCRSSSYKVTYLFSNDLRKQQHWNQIMITRHYLLHYTALDDEPVL